MASVSYLTMNSVQFGVGSSQVWEYVKRLPALGHEISLLSFEQGAVDPTAVLDAPAGLTWSPHHFGRGSVAAVRRVLACREAARTARDRIVHARSDLPALGTMMAGHQRWIWDMRAFWREQRLALGTISKGSPIELGLRELERQAARRSSAIICLAEAAVPVLRLRFGPDVARKATVIPTAVDTARFVPAVRRSRAGPIRVMLSGTYNSFYDGAAMAGVIAALRRRRPTEATWVGSGSSSPWAEVLGQQIDNHLAQAPFNEMPARVAGHDLGLVVCRADGGPALRAAMPTKIAEFLACGLPVVVNRGLGDMDALLASYRCGVALPDASHASQERAADELLDMLEEPDLAERCRACATDHFDLERSVQRLASLYEGLAGC